MDLATKTERGAATEPEGTSTLGIDVLDFLIILSKRRRFIFYFTLVATILSAIVLFLTPNQYTATTLVMPPGQSSSGAAILGQLGGAGSLASAAGASLGLKSPGALYLSLLRSRTLEETMVQRFSLMQRYHQKKMSGARGAFETHSTLSLGPKDGLITIGVRDRDPKIAAEIANGYVEEFRKFSGNLSITEAAQRRVFFQQQLLDAKQNLSAAEESMRGTEQSTGILQIDGQTRALIDSAASLRAQVMAKEVQLQGMRSYATEDNPEMVQAKQQLAALKVELAKLGAMDPDSGMLVPKGKVSEEGLEYMRKLRDVKYYETIYSLIAKQFEMAKLDEAGEGGTIQVIDAAVPPDQKSYPKRRNGILLAFLLSFVTGCVWSIVAERLHKAGGPKENDRLGKLWMRFR